MAGEAVISGLPAAFIETPAAHAAHLSGPCRWGACLFAGQLLSLTAGPALQTGCSGMHGLCPLPPTSPPGELSLEDPGQMASLRDTFQGLRVTSPSLTGSVTPPHPSTAQLPLGQSVLWQQGGPVSGLPLKVTDKVISTLVS